MTSIHASIEIADLPKSCPSCGHETSSFPIGVRGLRVVAECPACYVAVADLWATRRATVNR